jgi:glycosyltransferase involved in cell wall biosynthesis
MASAMASGKAPKVSVVLPTHNRAGLVGKAIESVLMQTFSDWELVIVDDASTDNTWEVLSVWAKKDERIKPFRNEKNNYPDISKTLNRGIEMARGRYIARLDDDDAWIDPKKLQKQVDFFESHPDYVVVGGGMIVVDGTGKELFRYFKKETDEQIRRSALFANPFSHTTVMFRTDIAREVGGYGNWRYAEDWDLWLKLGTKGKLYNFPEYFAAYLLAGQNKSFVHQRAQSRMTLEFITVHRKEYPNFTAAYLLNGTQYVYSFLPLWLRQILHYPLVALKRRSF